MQQAQDKIFYKMYLELLQEGVDPLLLEDDGSVWQKIKSFFSKSDSDMKIDQKELDDLKKVIVALKKQNLDDKKIINLFTNLVKQTSSETPVAGGGPSKKQGTGGTGGGGGKGTAAVSNPSAAISAGSQVTKPEQLAVAAAAAGATEKTDAKTAAEKPKEAAKEFIDHVAKKSGQDPKKVGKLLKMLMDVGALKSKISIVAEGINKPRSILLEHNGVVLGQIFQSDVKNVLKLLEAGAAANPKPVAAAKAKPPAKPKQSAAPKAGAAPAAPAGKQKAQKQTKPASPKPGTSVQPEKKGDKPDASAGSEKKPGEQQTENKPGPGKKTPGEAVEIPAEFKKIFDKLVTKFPNISKDIGKERAVKILSVIDDYFLVKEVSSRNGGVQLAERWQRLAGIL